MMSRYYRDEPEILGYIRKGDLHYVKMSVEDDNDPDRVGKYARDCIFLLIVTMPKDLMERLPYSPLLRMVNYILFGISWRHAT